jgi:protein phosphatase
MSQRGIKIQSSLILTTPGKRAVNEDYALIQPEKRFFVIADGFGGAIAGVEAAKRSCESVKRFLMREAGDLEATLPFVLRDYYSLAGNVLFNACLFANQEVMQWNRKQSSVHERGGCSLLSGFMDGNLLSLSSVGLCCARLIRQGRSVELVTPRSYARLKDPFQRVDGMNPLQIPLTAVGLSDHFEPEITEVEIQSGDYLLLYTDGVPEKVIHRIESEQGLTSVDQLKPELESVEYSENATLIWVVFG